MRTDTSERGLERLICTALAGHPCEPPVAGTVAEPPADYGGVGWSGGNPHDYDREYCVDLVQLSAFLRATQPKAAESLRLSEDGPTRRKFLARLQGEISKRGTIDVLRHGIRHGAHDLALQPHPLWSPAPPRRWGIARRSIRTYAVPHRNCEAASMKNITVSVDEETHRLARIRAAELDTSVSALVRDYLRSLAGGRGTAVEQAGVETGAKLRRTQLDEVLADFAARGVGLRMADNLSREEVYDRDAARAEAERERKRRASP